MDRFAKQCILAAFYGPPIFLRELAPRTFVILEM